MHGKIGAILLAAGAAGCGGGAPAGTVDPTVTPLVPPQPLDRVFVLESWGTPPEDTVLAVPAGEGRTAVIRRGAPDNSVYARVTFPPGSVRPAAGDTARVRLTIHPGTFGLDVETDAAIGAGAEVAFSYAIHFVAPEGARAVYGSEIRMERYLGIGRLEGDSLVVFLDSWRPASDVLTARLAGPGRYLVAAPRNPPGFRAIAF